MLSLNEVCLGRFEQETMMAVHQPLNNGKGVRVQNSKASARGGAFLFEPSTQLGW